MGDGFDVVAMSAFVSVNSPQKKRGSVGGRLKELATDIDLGVFGVLVLLAGEGGCIFGDTLWFDRGGVAVRPVVGVGDSFSSLPLLFFHRSKKFF